MILIADSGSTKCDWILDPADASTRTSTMGFNPFFHSSEFVVDKIMDDPVLSANQEKIEAVYYYGAGCSSAERCEIMRNALQEAFPNATKVVVDHDMVGAALAACNQSEGIVCILGTGSNSCYYDGSEIHQPILALGHILGDEGSGAYFGRKILRAFMRDQLPFELQQCIHDHYGLSQAELLAKVYAQERHLNVFLASVMKSVSSQKEHPYIQRLVKDGLTEFARISILCHPKYKDVPVYFVGSVGYHFQNIMQEVALILGFKIGGFVRRPIDELAKAVLSQEAKLTTNE